MRAIAKNPTFDPILVLNLAMVFSTEKESTKNCGRGFGQRRKNYAGKCVKILAQKTGL